MVREVPWGHEGADQSQAQGREDQSCEALGVRDLGTGEVHGGQAAHSGADHLVHRDHWGLDQMGTVDPRSLVCLAVTVLGND